MKAALPAGGQRLRNLRPEDVGVIAVQLLEAALMAKCFFQHVCDGLVHRFEQQVCIQGNLQRLTGITQFRMEREKRARTQDHDTPRMREGDHGFKQVY
jgi:hypothetical protein